ncbi:hypothetical protein [Nonomuraea aurantiaca]|uniref:hypothetical protein n=1 Tax=Nonomuraea aurantiaca TaxID=2878562 RepID=UPI001CD940A2|nr:hypothetical protein [Nonomuraea aurantiaca]MCA2225910.1 hypothetical protein [Nonomuraea aurantiaca]
MTDAIQVERMPATMRAARFVMTLEVAFSLVGLAIMIGTIAFAFSGPFLLLLLYTAVITAFMCWLLSRWSSRRKRVRWGAIAVEVVSVGGFLLMNAIDGGFGWVRLVSPGTLIPLALVIMLLTPSAARWFDR